MLVMLYQRTHGAFEACMRNRLPEAFRQMMPVRVRASY
jgi:hypothetical protein